jgi:hypothetical protein
MKSRPPKRLVGSEYTAETKSKVSVTPLKVLVIGPVSFEASNVQPEHPAKISGNTPPVPGVISMALAIPEKTSMASDRTIK